MKINKHFIITFVAILILGIPWLVNTYPQSARFIDKVFSIVNSNYAAVFHQESITINQLHQKYNTAGWSNAKVRVLVMPGHEPNYGGTEYKNIKERDLNVEVAKELAGFLRGNNHYEVVVARDDIQWNADLKKYFDENWSSIAAFLKESKTEMLRQVNKGTVSVKTDGVQHNYAPKDVALRLFGINKWSNENKIDLAIHIHFNDNPRYPLSQPGEYSGFSIYVPEKQYSNSTTTKVIADAVFKRLEKYNAVSNLPKEKEGVTEDQDLIAIGTFNTLDAPSMLIEYGYIYEPKFAEKKVRDVILKDLAFQTYLGIQDFFGGPNDVSLAYDTLMLPYNWKEDISKSNANKNDVLALQTALVLEGLYPGVGKSKNDCPITGKFGACTADALGLFQKKYGITGEKGIVGEQTKNILNSSYSLKLK